MDTEKLPVRIYEDDKAAARVGQVDSHCRRYEQAIADCGGIDFQILGLGRSGHIGFNEPGSSRDSREFWQRAEDRNMTTAATYDALGLPEYHALEAFARHPVPRSANAAAQLAR